ncbi:hypothetical protein HDU81_001887 [Chytriomyces hyalinus]|nr:hypothetical protein HDU81_001887 [Chytriomyces hyalinus]
MRVARHSKRRASPTPSDSAKDTRTKRSSKRGVRYTEADLSESERQSQQSEQSDVDSNRNSQDVREGESVRSLRLSNGRSVVEESDGTLAQSRRNSPEPAKEKRRRVRSAASVIPPFEEKDKVTFRDVCFTPPEQSKVHLILAWQERETDAVIKNSSIWTRKYLVKFADRSFKDVQWVDAHWLNLHAKMKLVNFLRADHSEQETAEDVIQPEWTLIGEIIQFDELHKKMLVSWKGRDLEEVTWEDVPEASSKQPDYEDALKRFNARKSINSERDRKSIASKIAKWRSKSLAGIRYQPKCITGGILHDYQVQGLDWLVSNYHLNSSSILADDMGLGKTIQVASFLHYLFRTIAVYPILVIVPNATISNWMRELAKWSPSLLVIEYRGSEFQRKQLQQLMFSPPAQKRELQCHIILTTYEIFTLDSTIFKGVHWEVGVLDEAHRLKNDESKLMLKLAGMNILHRVCLTGTPLQNNVRELFNLMNFVDPSSFRDKDGLEKEYETLNSDLVASLHEKLRPYFLRRTKAEVLSDMIPHKVEIFIPVSMTTLQRELYKAALCKNHALLASFQSIGSNFRTRGSSSNGNSQNIRKSSLLNVLMELRKILAHPYLIDGVEPPITESSEETVHARLIETSGKLALLHRLLHSLYKDNHRVLIFSQFTAVLDVLEDYLRGEEWGYCRLDGKMGADAKMREIDEFNSEGSDRFVFLLSTRSGGQGINLASADTIIIYDVDFNPHQDIQAMSRCHRLGQTKPVLILKMFTKSTAEEKILEIAKRKLILDHLIVESMAQEIEPENVESVLRFGAEALFKDDDEGWESNAIRYSDVDLEKLLDRTPPEEDADANKKRIPGGGAFGYTRTWTAGMDDDELKQNDAVKAEEDGGEDNSSEGADFWSRLLDGQVKSVQQPEEEFGKGKRVKKARLQYVEDYDEEYGPQDEENDGDFVLEDEYSTSAQQQAASNQEGAAIQSSTTVVDLEDPSQSQLSSHQGSDSEEWSDDDILDRRQKKRQAPNATSYTSTHDVLYASGRLPPLNMALQEATRMHGSYETISGTYETSALSRAFEILAQDRARNGVSQYNSYIDESIHTSASGRDIPQQSGATEPWRSSVSSTSSKHLQGSHAIHNTSGPTGYVVPDSASYENRFIETPPYVPPIQYKKPAFGSDFSRGSKARVKNDHNTGAHAESPSNQTYDAAISAMKRQLAEKSQRTSQQSSQALPSLQSLLASHSAVDLTGSHYEHTESAPPQYPQPRLNATLPFDASAGSWSVGGEWAREGATHPSERDYMYAEKRQRPLSVSQNPNAFSVAASRNGSKRERSDSPKLIDGVWHID